MEPIFVNVDEFGNTCIHFAPIQLQNYSHSEPVTDSIILDYGVDNELLKMELLQ
jgi:hypothetical protein